MRETIKTKTRNNQFIYKLLIIIIGISVPMLVLFLFAGEINLSKENWLVATWGKKWGILSDGQYGFGINSADPMIGWQPFVYAIAIISVVTIIFLILVKFKLINLSFYTIIFSSWFVFFSIMISGLLYVNPDPKSNETWKIFVRLIISAISFVVSFFPMNWLLNMIMLHSKNAEIYTEQLINNEITTATYIQDNIEVIKPKKRKKITSIDVKE